MEKDRKTKIFLVDDHSILRTSLRLYMEQNHLEIVGEAADGTTAIKLVPETSPDIIVIDLTLPDMDGIQLAQCLLNQNDSYKLIALTMHEESEYLLPFIEAGGVGYINKSAAGDDLLKAIHTVEQDGFYVSKAGMEVLTKMQRKKQKKEALPLSEREWEVLQLVVRGYTCREIGEQLFLSTRTVETYRMRIMHKLGMKNRSELVEYAMKHDIL